MSKKLTNTTKSMETKSSKNESSKSSSKQCKENCSDEAQAFDMYADSYELFTIVKLKDTGRYAIGIGDRAATDRTFQSVEDAKKYLKKTDWRLISSVVIALTHFMNKENKNENGNN